MLGIKLVDVDTSNSLKKQLSRDGLGYVLYNDAFEVREVEDDTKI